MWGNTIRCCGFIAGLRSEHVAELRSAPPAEAGATTESAVVRESVVMCEAADHVIARAGRWVRRLPLFL